jgi:hypothetical protein
MRLADAETRPAPGLEEDADVWRQRPHLGCQLGRLPAWVQASLCRFDLLGIGDAVLGLLGELERALGLQVERTDQKIASELGQPPR